MTEQPKSKEWLCGGTKIIEATKEQREYYAELDIVCPGCPDCEPEQPGVPVLAADSDGKLLKEKELRALDKHIKQNIEQPNTELLIVKTIQGLTTCINNELDKLSEGISVLEHCTRPNPKLIAKALEEIADFEKTTLFELQKAFE